MQVGVTAKLALGATQELVVIDGGTTLSQPGAAPVTAPGGVLAQTSNIGRYFRNEFAVVPEIGLKLGWQIRPHVAANVGYNFLYWSHVVRPGDQLDRTVNPSLAPTDQLFGNGLGANRPAFDFQSSSFWAQGLTVGLTFRY